MNYITELFSGSNTNMQSSKTFSEFCNVLYPSLYDVMQKEVLTTYNEIDIVSPVTENPYLLSVNKATPKSYSEKSTHLCPHTCKL